jgi:geranylgeranyl pyrophosphate synthase
MMDVLSRYAPYLAGCRTAISQDLANAPLGPILSEYFERGKMLRPLLLFVSTSAVGGDPADAVAAAQALELLHAASLIHDDIIDQAPERRGRPALHLRIGIGPAVVLGDYLILRSYTVFGKTKSGRVLEALGVLSQCAEECCRGQIEELTSEMDDSEESYFSIVRGKTASQFVAAATVGGILGNGLPDQIAALRAFALNIGISFQIRDDELDITGEEALTTKQTGKHPGDSSPGRPTLPLIYLRKYGSKTALQKFSQMQRDGSTSSDLLGLLHDEGVLDRLRIVKEQHLQRAVEAADCFRNSTEAGAMITIAHQVIARDS